MVREEWKKRMRKWDKVRQKKKKKKAKEIS